MITILESKQVYYNVIDEFALKIAEKYLQNKSVTLDILEAIHNLYISAKLNEYENEQFNSAYHNPITSDVEFLIARIIYQIIKIKGLGWKVNLRKQKNKCAPDIRIEYNNKTIYLIEIKVKAGWIQQIFSDRRFEHDKERYEKGLINVSPNKRVEELKRQFDKYEDAFNIDKSKIFVLVATLSNVHRKKYSNLNVSDYKKTFIRNSSLPVKNLIVLSHNLNIDISTEDDLSKYEPSPGFEEMLKIIFGETS